MTESTKKPVRYMDFVGGRRASSTDPLISRPAAKRVPTTSKVATPKPKKLSTLSAKKSVQKPVQKPTPKPIQKPVAKQLTPKVLGKTPEKIPSASSEKTQKPAPKPQDESPDNNFYSLGGKSPFLTNYSVDKRPLSNSVPKDNKKNFSKIAYEGDKVSEPKEELPRKNVYEKKSLDTPSKKKETKERSPVTIIEDEGKNGGVPIIVIIILTIILGAAVGAGIYFVLPK